MTAASYGSCSMARPADCECRLAHHYSRVVATAKRFALLCANLAIGATNPSTWSIPMAAAKKSSRSRGGRKRAGSSGRSRGGARKRSSSRSSRSSRSSSRTRGARKSSSRRRGGSARKSSRKSSSRSSGRKSGGRKSSRKSSTRKSGGRKRSGGSRRRSQSPVARVKRVATGVVHQAAGLGERAVDSVTEFVQDRF